MNHKHWDHHVIGPVSTNCYIFGDRNEAILLDPGGPEAKGIVQKLMKQEIEIKHVLASHGHFDHLSWATEVQKATEGAKVYLHKDEKPFYEDYHDAMRRYGLPQPELREPDIWLQTGELLKIGGYDIRVIHTPGHSPGSSTFLIEKLHKEDTIINSAFVGDCLFRGSIGRTDLLGGSISEMQKSLKYLLETLNTDTQIFPGHGSFTNMKWEKENNPFLLAIQKGIPIY